MSRDRPDFFELGERIRAARKRKGLKQQQLADEIGVSRQTLSKYENGRRRPEPDQIDQIASATDVDADWITPPDPTVANQALSDQEPEDVFSLSVYTDVRPAAGNGNIIYEVDELEPLELMQSKRRFKDLLGFWPPDDLRGTYIQGQSMNRPSGPYEDGQLVLYVPVNDLQDGERYLLLVEDAHTGDWRLLFKKVRLYAGGGVKLISENPSPEFDNELLLPEDGDLVHQTTGLPVHMRVIGRVVWPEPYDDSEEAAFITRTIERLAQRGVLSS
jgi:transcriptional regulator with XRE-family HTH domain